MRLLITGICGFAGFRIARALLESCSGLELLGIDNLARPGSELNRGPLQRAGAKLIHGDIRLASDVDALPPVDWVIDAAATPSVLAGLAPGSSRQLVEHNLYGTHNLLEYCARHRAGLILLSTSRVYSIPPLAALPVRTEGWRLVPDDAAVLPAGVSSRGISEAFSTEAPVSLYGATKRASEVLALEFGHAHGFPVWINRCGVLAGPGQFGKADQGIFSYWIHMWTAGRPLRYIGFGGYGHQVRDCLDPRDLTPLLLDQMRNPAREVPRTLNLAGGVANSMSLRELSGWCAENIGPGRVEADREPRPYDLPWVVLDNSRAAETRNWSPQTALDAILREIREHAAQNPGWLDVSNA